jgi:hypothetical protein
LAKKHIYVWESTDFFGNLVSLKTQTWAEHILDGHPEMTGHEQLVMELLRDPDEVCMSTHYDTAAVFISELGVIGAEGFRVVVPYDHRAYEKGAATGKVATAYPIDSTLYPTPRVGKTIFKKKK